MEPGLGAMRPVVCEHRALACKSSKALAKRYGAGDVTTVVPPVTKVEGTAPVPRMILRKP